MLRIIRGRNSLLFIDACLMGRQLWRLQGVDEAPGMGLLHCKWERGGSPFPVSIPEFLRLSGFPWSFL